MRETVIRLKQQRENRTIHVQTEHYELGVTLTPSDLVGRSHFKITGAPCQLSDDMVADLVAAVTRAVLGYTAQPTLAG